LDEIQQQLIGTHGTSLESRAGPISDRVVNPVALSRETVEEGMKNFPTITQLDKFNYQLKLVIKNFFWSFFWVIFAVTLQKHVWN
jgi:hypothetical protein